MLSVNCDASDRDCSLPVTYLLELCTELVRGLSGPLSGHVNGCDYVVYGDRTAKKRKFLKKNLKNLLNTVSY